MYDMCPLHTVAQQKKLLTRNICLARFVGYHPNFHKHVCFWLVVCVIMIITKIFAWLGRVSTSQLYEIVSRLTGLLLNKHLGPGPCFVPDMMMRAFVHIIICTEDPLFSVVVFKSSVYTINTHTPHVPTPMFYIHCVDILLFSCT